MKRIALQIAIMALVVAIVSAEQKTDTIDERLRQETINTKDSTTLFTNDENGTGASNLRATMSKTSRIIANPQIAMSNPDYLVTPGDVYILSFSTGTNIISMNIVLDASYKMRIANLSVVDARGKTFLELKTLVEGIVSRNYAMSGVQFVLSVPSQFQVSVTGEVKETIDVDAWSLSRLSSIIEMYLLESASIRDVAVKSAGGQIKTYDLFRYKRDGDLSQNPYVRPGDEIRINRASRTVTIDGAVVRPGRYQLLDGENLKDAIDRYAGGPTQIADMSRIELIRYVKAKTPSGEKEYLGKEDIDRGYPLEDFDSIFIRSKTDLLPVIFIEGAIKVEAPTDSVSQTDDNDMKTSSREVVRYNPGENYASLVRKSQKMFTSVSDTAHAYILRDNSKIMVNLNQMLYDAAFISTYYVEPNDVLVIPFRQYFVSVSGAVERPGRYPYIPDRDAYYYIDLAGGFNPLRNSGKSFSVRDISGEDIPRSSFIPPEGIIKANNNAFLYYFNQYAPIITTTLSVITAYLTVRATTN